MLSILFRSEVELPFETPRKIRDNIVKTHTKANLLLFGSRAT